MCSAAERSTRVPNLLEQAMAAGVPVAGSSDYDIDQLNDRLLDIYERLVRTPERR
jgi:hypothetical protein